MKENYDVNIFHQITEIENCSDGKTYKISIQVPMKVGWIERMKFSIIRGGEKSAYQMKHVKNENEYVYFETEVFLKNSALYYYYFSFEANRVFRYFKKLNITGDSSISAEEYWKMSVGFDVPNWAKGTIWYHVFVDRYRRGNPNPPEQIKNRKVYQNWQTPLTIGPDENGNWNVDFYGGDLKGIEETLNYIKSLGVSVIFLSPVVQSQSNHRYDTADYENVDPYAGGNEALKSLCKAAHRKNMKVILDAVFNHTGNDSKYFNQFGTYPELGAYQSESSIYSSFYRTYWDRGERKFAFWWGMPNLPECDGNSPTWKNYILGEGGIIDQWFALGIDALRLDVADELTDEFIEGIHVAVKRNKEDGFIIGEVWENPMRMNRSYISSGKAMHSIMNYYLTDALIRYFKYSDCNKLRYVLREVFTEYPTETIQSWMNFTSTHDISRAIEIFGCNDFQMYSKWGWNLQDESLEWARAHQLTREQYLYGREVYQAYVFTLMFMPGNVSIFYGDEVGLQGIGNLKNRAPYPWGKRDKKLLRFFRTIGKIRKKEQELLMAEFKEKIIDDQKYAFERVGKSKSMFFVVSRTHSKCSFKVPEEYSNYDYLYSLGKYSLEETNDGRILTLQPYSAITLVKQSTETTK